MASSKRPSLDSRLPAFTERTALSSRDSGAARVSPKVGLERRKRPAEAIDESVAPKAKRVHSPSSPGLMAIKEAMASAPLTSKKSKAAAFDELVSALRNRDDFVGFNWSVVGTAAAAGATEGGGGAVVRWLEVCRDAFDVIPPLAMVPSRGARVLLSSGGVIAFEALGRPLSRTDDLPIDQWKYHLDKFISRLEFDWSFCAGISASDASASTGRFDVERAPFHCYRAPDCQLWAKKKSLRLNRCQSCSLSLRKELKKTGESSGAQTSADSRTKLSTLSPNSLLKRARLLAAKSRASCQKARVVARARVEAMDLQLAKSQSKQLRNAAGLISSDFSQDLQAVLGETESSCDKDFADACREAWALDQRRNKVGCKGNRWSVLTLRLAMAVFARSPAAYDKLKCFPIFQLPSVRQLQRKVAGAYSSGQGVDMRYLEEQSRLYKAAQSGKRLPGRQVGILVFDESKIVSKLCWNSKSHKLYGIAATSSDLSSLSDVYKSAQSDCAEPAEYVLQFVWRDLTSKFDLLGPYWFSSKSLHTAGLLAHLYPAMRCLEATDFKVAALVCDGAAYNMALLKMLCAKHVGAFGSTAKATKDQDGDRFRVPCQFDNPFRPGNPIFTIICPTHLLKNCINAMHNSRRNGTKALRLSDKYVMKFGWEVIESMWEREKQRRPSRSQLVRKLLHSYIVRDSWTKLNVRPAKIMQQEEVISELKFHLLTKPDDSEAVEQAVQYLEACNLLFERGFLSHEKLTGLDSAPAQSVARGYLFLRTWHRNLERHCADFAPTAPKEKRFLSWQTWDLLRLSIFGFLDLAKHFSANYPDYFIIPHRVNGSAVETVFSQVRQRVSGPVTSVNYPSGLTKLQVSADCDPQKHDSERYRSDSLGLLSSKKR